MKEYEELKFEDSPKEPQELLEEDLGEAMKLVDRLDYGFNESTRLQVEGMSKFTGIELQPEEVRLYCALREQMPIAVKDDESKKVSKEANRVWRLSDQRLLAAVLGRSSDKSRFHKFISFYPEIFK